MEERARPRLVQKWDRERQARHDRILARYIGPVTIKHRGTKKSVSKKKAGSKRQSAQFIYLIASDQTFKIGRSNDIKRRFSSIKCHSPIKLELRHYFQCDDAVKVEKRLHRLFKDVRSHGEWFHLTQADVAFICGLSRMNYEIAIRELVIERQTREEV